MILSRPTIHILLLCGFLSACNSDPNSSVGQQETVETVQAETESPYPALLTQAFDAHGSYAKWEAQKTMDFKIDKDGVPERHLVNLKNRNTLIQYGEKYHIGFDGNNVWVHPNKAAFGKGSPRFYHNLRFYFVAMPFIIGDSGINYKVLPQKEMLGKNYDALSVTYNEGVGDAPDDEYILLLDPETHRMEWLLYTVTYYSGKPEMKYNALHYSEWQVVDDLLLPSKMEGYKYEDGKITDKRYERIVNDLFFSVAAPHPNFFEMPDGAEIDSLIQH